MATSCDSPSVVVCEGKSELTYLQALNRLMVRGAYRTAPFAPVRAINGTFKNLRTTYCTVRKQNPRSIILIWADKDLFIRNSDNSETLYKQKRNLPDFMFSTFNFEDFWMLHTPNLPMWIQEMQQENHFLEPLREDAYLPIFKRFYPNYKKGSLPVELSRQLVETMLERNSDSTNVFPNDFASYLSKQIQAGILKWYE